ncbi:MAG TPA: D-glycero-beta-D-manno-heptose-7-phosphate kinase, partial [Flavobacteriales bacterium]|nr:D-glycero-beta-D-manno-heptose-7-phosphate kinase [Flavobacteriales bacterium]
MSKVDQPLPFDTLPWERPKVCVVGDVMVDAYMWGRVSRVSPEAPVPVVDVTKREIRAGGAGNVVKNLHALGAEVTLVSVVGQDASGADLTNLLEDVCAPHLVVDSSRPTTVKTRVISGGQHVVRVDEESTEDVTSAVGQDVLSTFKALLEGASRPDVVILEDYDKGLLTEDTVAALIAACQQAGVPVAVDPKLKRFQAYQGVALFKPNLKELNEGLGLTEPVHPQQTSNMAKAVERLRSDLGCARVMVTLGEHGTWIHAPQ